MKHLNILMIPTDYCNMNCTYCFFNKNINNSNFMDISVFYQLAKITLPFYDSVSFIWHGGEPLALGIDFYKQVVEIQNEYISKYSVSISNSIQSNFTLLTSEMVEFFNKHNFSLSTSYDGIKNDFTRGNSINVLNGINLLFQHNTHCGAIMVASKINIDTLIESYNFFKSKHIGFDVNPYLGDNENLRLDYDIFINKMIDLFEYWAKDSDTIISISSFEEILNYVLFKKKYYCSHRSCLGKWASVDYNGIIKPCNRHFPDEYSYGNIYDYNSFDEAFNSEGFKTIIQKAITRRKKCKECEIFDYCSGGCNYLALIENNGIENNNGNYCKYLKSLYRKIENFIFEHKNDHTLNKYIKSKIQKSRIE